MCLTSYALRDALSRLLPSLLPGLLLNRARCWTNCSLYARRRIFSTNVRYLSKTVLSHFSTTFQSQIPLHQALPPTPMTTHPFQSAPVKLSAHDYNLPTKSPSPPIYYHVNSCTDVHKD
ncbi:hypothetical protein BC629DRAFT_1518298 [Irpex lacteus]|nr:hypothetical protein BC629DRAFT_1518298 [Irpex lacteus]